MSKRTGIMLAKQATPAYIARSPVWIVQPKLNGDRCRAIVGHGQCQLISSQGNDRNFAVPHIVRELSEVFTGNIVEFDGELYKHGMRHQDIRSIVSRTTERHPDYEQIEYHIFDVINDDPQDKRLVLRESLLNGVMWAHIVCVSSYAESIGRINDRLAEFIGDGYEGVILRHPYAPYVRKRTASLLKIKPRQEMICQIHGFDEEISIHGEFKGSLGALSVANIKGGPLFGVGSGVVFTRAFRQGNWPAHHLLGKTVRIRYQELSKEGKPIMPVLMEVL